MPIRDWFNARKVRRDLISVAVLPRRASCFRGVMEFQLPADFRIRRKTESRTEFSGSRSGMELLVMRMPFSVNVRRITAADLQLAFRNILPMQSVPAVEYSFLRHSPALTAEWRASPDTGNLLHLIQVRGTVFLMLITKIPADGRETAEGIIRSAELHTALL